MADAVIYPDSGLITIDKDAYIHPLRRSMIVVNESERPYKFFNSNIEIKGKINYFNNYIKNQNKLENLFDGIYKINGSFSLKTTNEEKWRFWTSTRLLTEKARVESLLFKVPETEPPF